MPPPQQRPRPPGSSRPEAPWRIAGLALAAIVVLALFLPSLMSGSDKSSKLTYNQVISSAEAGQVTAAKVNNDTGKITGTVVVNGDTQKFSVTGPRPIPDAVEAALRKNVKALEFTNESTSVWLSSGTLRSHALAWRGRRCSSSRRSPHSGYTLWKCASGSTYESSLRAVPYGGQRFGS